MAAQPDIRSLVKATLMVLLAGVSFWIGAIYAASHSQPNVEIRRLSVPAQPANLVIPCGEEYQRICRQRRKSL